MGGRKTLTSLAGLALAVLGVWLGNERKELAIATEASAQENSVPRQRGHGPVQRTKSSGRTFYVSKRGNNRNGRSWSNAWRELDQVDWRVIQPGDTVLIDGGATDMTYTTSLSVETNGVPGLPITIQRADQPGRNGQVAIFGGRTRPLPFCGQQGYNWGYLARGPSGIDVSDRSWIVIDGGTWRGFSIHGHNNSGVQFNSRSNNIAIRNAEIFDNGTAVQRNSGWSTDSPGVSVAGHSITLERLIVHDNGQDAIQSGGVSDFTLRESWLYNERPHPTVGGDSFNYCTHSDGLQIYNGGRLSGFNVTETIIGPGLTNGALLGSHGGRGIEAVTNDVVFQDVVFSKAAENAVASYPGTKPRNWLLDHVTVYASTTRWQAIYLEGRNHLIRDSVVVGGMISLPDGNVAAAGNCQWNTLPGWSPTIGALPRVDIGKEADPRFLAVDDKNTFSLDDYSLRSNSPCRGMGSRVSSVEQLLGRP